LISPGSSWLMRVKRESKARGKKAS